MTISGLKDQLPDYARDLKLNLSSVLTPAGAPGLNESQIFAIALATAIASRNPTFARQVETTAREHLDEPMLNAARAAAAIMGMNNIYYRFVHLAGAADYANMPARLRMSVIGNPGIDKVDFELLSLAVSAVNGCGMCITAHEKTLRDHGLSKEAIQSAIRIAAVVHGVATVQEQAIAA